MSSPQKVDDRRPTAVHEIGHAMMCAIFELDMRKISIYQSFFNRLSYGGKVNIAWKECYATDLDLLCMVCLGGQEAQSLWLEREYGYDMPTARSMTDAGSSKDLRDYRRYAAFADHFNIGMSKPEYQKKTDKILLSRWPQILLLGERLDERKRLAPGAVTAQTRRKVSVPGVEIRQFEPVVRESSAA